LRFVDFPTAFHTVHPFRPLSFIDSPIVQHFLPIGKCFLFLYRIVHKKLLKDFGKSHILYTSILGNMRLFRRVP
jgi:hypothetical protein